MACRGLPAKTATALRQLPGGYRRVRGLIGGNAAVALTTAGGLVALPCGVISALRGWRKQLLISDSARETGIYMSILYTQSQPYCLIGTSCMTVSTCLCVLHYLRLPSHSFALHIVLLCGFLLLKRANDYELKTRCDS